MTRQIGGSRRCSRSAAHGWRAQACRRSRSRWRTARDGQRRRLGRLSARTTPASSTTPTTSTRRCGCLRVDLTAAVKAGRTSRCSAKSAARTRRASGPTRSTCRIRPWTDARLRHPGRPRPADLRRLRAAHLRDRQPADRLSARLSVPDLAAARRAAGQRRRAAADARPRLAGRTTRSATRPRTAACRWSARSAGTPACRCTRPPASLSATASVTTGTLSNPLFSRRQRRTSVRRTASAAAGRRAGRRRVGARAGRSSARRRRERRWATATDGAVHADRLGRRRRVLARLLPGPARDDRQPLEAADRAAAGDQLALRRRSARVDLGRRPLQDAAWPLRRGARRSSRLQRRDRARRRRCRGTRR